MALQLHSPDFEDGGALPRRLTCEGDDVSPALSWQEAPAGTRSYALVVDDPDAPDPEHPRTRWVHWVLYNLPAGVHALPGGARARLPAGAREGLNDWKRTGYGGPCPPIGRHRYVHTLYALDCALPEAALGAPTRERLEAAMAGHVLARAQRVGTYQKQQG